MTNIAIVFHSGYGHTQAVAEAVAAGAQAILPGIYSVMVRTVVRSRLPDGSPRDFDADSNQATLSIVPRIVTLTFAAGIGTITVDGFQPHLIATNDMLVFAGGDKLTRTTANPPAPSDIFNSAP